MQVNIEFELSSAVLFHAKCNNCDSTDVSIHVSVLAGDPADIMLECNSCSVGESVDEVTRWR